MLSNQSSSAAVYVGGPSRHAIAEFVAFYTRHKKATSAIKDAIAVDRGVEAVCQPTISRFAEGLARHLGRGRDEEKDDAQLRTTLMIVQLERFCFMWIMRDGWNLDRGRTIPASRALVEGDPRLILQSAYQRDFHQLAVCSIVGCGVHQVAERPHVHAYVIV